MPSQVTPQSRLVLAQALDQMVGALEILDEAGAPGEVGATLDLAIAKLRKLLERDDPVTTGVRALFGKLENELSLINGERAIQPNPWEIPPV